MKKLFMKTLAPAMMLMMSVSAMAIDWSGISWVGNGAGGDYTNKYKFYTEGGPSMVNIQHPGFATADGFYITFPDAAFNAVEGNGATLTFDQQGAGIVLHMTNFTAKETECVVKNNAETRWTFYIYYEDGEEGGGEELAESNLALTSDATVALDLGGETTSQITYTTSSTGAVTYKSSAESVATVSADGLITAVGGGSATITVSQAKDATYKAGSVTVTVTVTGEVATTWTDFMGNGGVDSKYNNLYKVGYQGEANKPTIANMQKPDWAAEAGIYMSFPAAGITCSHECAVQGAGICLYLDQFTRDITEVTVNYAGGSKTFYISNAGGMPAIDKEAASQASSGNAALGCDGNAGTRWESAQTDDQWWCVKYNEAVNFNNIKIIWEGAYGKSFNLYGSNDGEAWTTLAEVRNQTLEGFPYNQIIALENTVSYKYVAFRGIARGTQYGYSFWEFETYVRQDDVLTSLDFSAAASICKVGETVQLTATPKNQYGIAMEAEVTYTIEPATAGHVTGNVYTADAFGSVTITATAGELSQQVSVFNYAGENVALNKTATALYESGYNEISRLTDGNDATEWQGDPSNGTNELNVTCGFSLDLGAKYDLGLVTIHFEGACSDAYTLETSADGETYAEAHAFSGSLGINNHTDLLYGANLANAEGVRYIRFTSTKNSTQWGMKIYEFQVFGEETPASHIVNVTTAGWATACLPNAVSAAEGTTLYTGVLNGTNLVLTEHAEIPANTAFLVAAEEGNYELEVISEAAAIENNDLVGVLVATPYSTISEANGGKLILTLGLDAEGVAGFRQPMVGTTELEANKACLPYEGEMTAPIRLLIGQATNLRNAEAEIVVDKVIVNGRLMILRGKNIYNADGRIVK